MSEASLPPVVLILQASPTRGSECLSANKLLAQLGQAFPIPNTGYRFNENSWDLSNTVVLMPSTPLSSMHLSSMHLSGMHLSSVPSAFHSASHQLRPSLTRSCCCSPFQPLPPSQVVLLLSHSGGTFATLNVSNLLKGFTSDIFVITSEWDTQIARSVRAGKPGRIGSKFQLNSYVFTTFCGCRPAEPVSLTAVATHQVLAQTTLNVTRDPVMHLLVPTPSARSDRSARFARSARSARFARSTRFARFARY